jgi:hypothetical protein
MYVHNVVGTGSYTTSTTNMYNKDQFHVHPAAAPPLPPIKSSKGIGRPDTAETKTKKKGES